jgi:hypothetical protein
MSKLGCCVLCGSTEFVSRPAKIDSLFPWLVTHQCIGLGCTTTLYTCSGSCNGKSGRYRHNLKYSDYFTNMKQVKRHHKACHEDNIHRTVFPATNNPSVPSVANGKIDFDSRMYDVDDSCTSPHEDDSSSEGDVFPFPDYPEFDGDELVEEEVVDLHYGQIWPDFEVPDATTAQQFERNIVDGNALLAASVLISRACFQSPSISASVLPLPNIMLFLYIAKLVMSLGTLQQYNLSRVLSILYPYVAKYHTDWIPIPCTVSGFRSRILNVSNSNSLVSILPIPSMETLHDGHGYTPFRDILRHALMMKIFRPEETKDPKWKSLSCSQKFKDFLEKIANKRPRVNVGLRQLAVGLLVWTDGWDTSTGCKSNRSPMHTGTVTLLIVDVESKEVVGIATYPNMSGPGKIDHDPVFRLFQQDISVFQREDGNNRIFLSRHYSCEVEVHTEIMFVVQDQPERRGASGLLGGNSRLHPLFGMSCDFVGLKLPFQACVKCAKCLDEYLEAKDWTQVPMESHCEHCLGWSLQRLVQTSYQTSFECPANFNEDTPGATLFEGPGPLPSSLLIDAWNHGINMFAHKACWLESDVKRYFKQLCINDATVAAFISSCRRYVYLREMSNNREEYSLEEIENTILDAQLHPESYELPLPPAMWSLGDTKDKTEGIMHLSMGIQKAIFKFVIRWSTENKNGSKLQRRLADSLGAVQDLKVAYCPCRPYKDDKFGGFTAEVYRAMTMTSPYIYRCLLEMDLQPAARREPNTEPQYKWTKQDNINWMNMRGVEHSSSILAPEAREQVRREMAKFNPPQPIHMVAPEPISTEEIRDLIWRMYNMFRAIFCTDLAETKAKNRATASVMRFLCHIESLDLKLNPKREKPIWIAKFNFLGLLRVCESFVPFRHVRNLYEGGIIGEGIVKELRPLVAKGVHCRWATNLLLAHYRQQTLDILIDSLDNRSGQEKGCFLGHHVEPSKFKRYTTSAEVVYEMNMGRPLTVLLFGSNTNWRAGAIIVSQKFWYFREIDFLCNEDSVDDAYGLTYHRVHQAEQEICFGRVDGDDFEKNLGHLNLPFWDYGVLFPDLIEDTVAFRYAIVRTGWQYLNVKHEWSEYE